MREKSFEILFSKVGNAIVPVCVDYGREIIKEALKLPEKHVSLNRNYPNFTPIIEKYRNEIMNDKRFIKVIPIFREMKFFEEFEGKIISLEHYVFEVEPINFLLMVLEYVLLNPEASLGTFRIKIQLYGSRPEDDEIDAFNIKGIKLALKLFGDVISSSDVHYVLDSTLFGFIGDFNSIKIGEYTLSSLKVPLKIYSDQEPFNVGLINIRKNISIQVRDLIFNNKELAMKSKLLSFLSKDPAMEFAEFLGFIMELFESKSRDFFLYVPDRHIGGYLGSLGTFFEQTKKISNAYYEGQYFGIAVASLQKNLKELNNEDLNSIKKIWDIYFDKHVKSGDNVGTTLKRLGMSSIRRLPEDKLIDLIVGFESLIGIKPKDRSTRDAIGIRAALLIKNNIDSYEIISEAYRIRNELLHSGKSKVKEEDLERVIDSLTQLLGIGISEYAHLFEREHFKDESALVKYLDDSLFKETQKAIHGSNLNEN